MDEKTPAETVLAEGNAEALAPWVELLAGRGIQARIVLKPGSNPNH